MTRKPVIGLIGGIGSGKSRVAAEFAKRGGRVVDGDRAGHDALRRPDVIIRLVDCWGSGIVKGDGTIDRRKVAQLVFSDLKELRILEAIVFPVIGQDLKEQIEAAVADPAVRFVVLDAAVMLEAGWNTATDRLVYVHVPRTERLRRLSQHRGLSPEEVQARERAELPLTVKATRADHAIDNSGPPEALAEQVDRLLRPWGLA